MTTRNLLMILTFLAAASGLRAGMIITLESEVYLAPGVITLSDFATIKASDDVASQTTARVAANAMFGRTPMGRIAKSVTADAVRVRLMTASGISSDDFQIKGATTTSIYNAAENQDDYERWLAKRKDAKAVTAAANKTEEADKPNTTSNAGAASEVVIPVEASHRSAAVAAPAQPVLNLVERAIEEIHLLVQRQRPQLKPEQIVVTKVNENFHLRQFMQDQPGVNARVLTSVDPERVGQAVWGRLNFKIGATLNGVAPSDILILTVMVERLDDVVKLTRDVRKGQELVEGDLQVFRERLTTDATNYYSSINDLLGATATKALRAGQVIEPTEIRPPLMVRRNDTVVATVQVGQVPAKLTGKASGDGVLGDVITITVEVRATDPKGNQSVKNKVYEVLITGKGTGIVRGLR